MNPGAFLLRIRDLTYYAVLRQGLGWPESLGTWDGLFLSPAPWVAVWAPVIVARLLGGRQLRVLDFPTGNGSIA